MYAILVSLLIASTAITIPTPAAKNAKTSTDFERFQGEWVVVECETEDGVSMHSPYEKELGSTIRFEKETARAIECGIEVAGWRGSTFTLNPTTKVKRIEIQFTRDGVRQTRRGIYSFEDDTLVVYLGDSRPTSLTAKPGSGDIILRLKRPML